jgi:exopolysaccharide biosynthesis WecB/TagA/CpsF family protein
VTTPPTRRFLGVDFTLEDQEQALASVATLAAGKRLSSVITPNVDHLVRLHRHRDTAWNPAFARAYERADRVYCDSRILALLAGRSHIDLPVVPGSDLTAQLFARIFGPQHVVAIIGGAPAMIAQLRQHYPGLTILHHEPPMGLLHNAAAQRDIVAFVRQTGADFTLFAIGAPQSEIVADQCREDPDCCGVALCIGASIEFIVGAKQRAPRWMQSMRLEWLFRLASEPRRLWRRYLVEGPQIFSIYWADRKHHSDS